MKISIDDEINIGDMFYDPLSKTNVVIIDIGSDCWIKVESVDFDKSGWAHRFDFEYLEH